MRATSPCCRRPWSAVGAATRIRQRRPVAGRARPCGDRPSGPGSSVEDESERAIALAFLRQVRGVEDMGHRFVDLAQADPAGDSPVVELPPGQIQRALGGHLLHRERRFDRGRIPGPFARFVPRLVLRSGHGPIGRSLGGSSCGHPGSPVSVPMSTPWRLAAVLPSPSARPSCACRAAPVYAGPWRVGRKPVDGAALHRRARQHRVRAATLLRLVHELQERPWRRRAGREETPARGVSRNAAERIERRDGLRALGGAERHREREPAIQQSRRSMPRSAHGS